MDKTEPATTRRILIVDDHPVIRETLSDWIRRHADLQVCGEAADFGDAIRSVDLLVPELAIVDISLPSGDGIELVKRIRDRHPQIKVVVWSAHDDGLYAERALRAGALAYVNKDRPMETLVEAIRRALGGRVWLCEAMTERMLRLSVGLDPAKVTGSPIDALADRELETLRLIGEGLKTSEVAKRMHLSVHTVETYRDRIRQKLGIKNGAELTRFAMSWVLHEDAAPKLSE